MTILQAIIVAIVEGITEFLPISSTGHMILTQRVLGIESTDFVKLFTVSIQFGAIISVIVLYWKKFLSPIHVKPNPEATTLWKKSENTFGFYFKLFVAFLPAVFFGLLLKKQIDAMLESALTVAVSLVLGGIVLLFVDKWFMKTSENQEISYNSAFKIGLFQVISMIPGVSRSAATIIGGMSQHLSRKNAAEFSFFLAVPTMFAATVKGLYDTYSSIDSSNIHLLIIGNIVAFIVAMIAIKTFIGFLTKYGFKAFGWYRIIVGLLFLFLISQGIIS